jgi:NADP-dependent 3-hydroxy acid dehydrogenase YdfG
MDTTDLDHAGSQRTGAKLAGTVAIVTGASSGIGSATARLLAAEGASVALVARRRDRLVEVADEIESTGGTALVVEADITDRSQAVAAVAQTVDRFGRLDILVNNAGLMLLGPVSGADVEEWERMLAVNVEGLLYMTNAALPHLLEAASDDLRGVADIVNISSTAGRKASANYAVYNLTKFGVNGFTDALRQEMTSTRVRVGVLEPGAVDTELLDHNSEQIYADLLEPFNKTHVRLVAGDIAEGIAFMVTRPWHAAVAEMLVLPSDQA